ncbi:MAG: class I SAM-dependent methyltransferase [Chloroflexi bacterium]|nr:class I SAM-dependent methyltransferase [Chloroflexota bacterium]
MPDYIDTLVNEMIDDYGLTQLHAEFSRLLRLLEEMQPRTLVEIGTASGESSWAFRQIVPADCLVITVDIKPVVRAGPFPTARNGFGGVHIAPRIVTPSGPIHRILADSHQSSTRTLIEAVMAKHGRTAVDALFIDGDHSEEGVRADFALYAPLVREGGVVAFHDIVDSPYNEAVGHGVHRLWRDLVLDAAWDTREIKDRSDRQWGDRPVAQLMGIGVAIKKEPAEPLAAAGGGVRWLAYQPVFAARMAAHLLGRAYQGSGGS